MSTSVSQITADDILRFKQTGHRFVGGSVYEQMDTLWAIAAGMEIVLIGDSLANIKLGYDKTADVSMDEMLTFTKACLRAAAMARRHHSEVQLPLFVFDIPYCRMHSPGAVVTACEEAQAATRHLDVPFGAVKIEVHQDDVDWRAKLAALRLTKIPFIVHIGYTPQVQKQIDQKIVQGKTAQGAVTLAELVCDLQDSGAFALFVESVPWQLGKIVTANSRLPVISLGAGPHAHGQWIMVSDVLGITDSYFRLLKRNRPVFSPLTTTGEALEQRLAALVNKARSGEFPVIGEHTYALPAASSAEIIERVEDVFRRLGRQAPATG